MGKLKVKTMFFSEEETADSMIKKVTEIFKFVYDNFNDNYYENTSFVELIVKDNENELKSCFYDYLNTIFKLIETHMKSTYNDKNVVFDILEEGLDYGFVVSLALLNE